MSYMTPVYRIINDYTELEKYVESLPDLGEQYKYYISLFARKKYGGTEGLTSDKCQLKRCVASKDRIIQKLKQMEVPVGAYTFQGKPGESEIIVNQASLVAYISANPRDMHKAAGATAKKLVTQIVDGQTVKNPQAEALSQIQTHGKKIWFNVDVDFHDKANAMGGEGENEFYLMLLSINQDAYEIIETRGGFHVLVNLEKLNKEHKKTWYNDLGSFKSDHFEVDMKNGDGMVPIPGCVQSEFTPKVV